jgi:hypothetical protein
MCKPRAGVETLRRVGLLGVISGQLERGSGMSASPSKADILKVDSDVRLVPEADFSSSYFISGDDGSSSLLVSAADRAAAPSAAAARARSASWVLNL